MVDVAVLLVLRLLLGRDKAAALSAPDESAERGGVVLVALAGMAPALQYLLYLVPELLRDDGLVLAFIDFPGVAEEAGIEGIGEDVRYLVLPEQIAGVGDDAVLSEESGHVHEGGFIFGIQLEGGPHGLRFPAVDDDGLRPRIVQVSHRRGSRVLAAPCLLEEGALRVLGKIADILVRHPELEAHEDDVVGRVVAPVGGADVRNDALLQEPLDAGGVNRVPGEAVELPAEDALRPALFYAVEHVIEHGAPRRLGGLLLDELGSDAQPLASREGAKDGKLVVNRADLLVFDVGRFAGVEEVLRHGWIISQRIV